MNHTVTIRQDLLTMTLEEVLQTMVRSSGKAWDEVGAEMSWGQSATSRIRGNDGYWPTLPTLVRLCVVTGSTLLPEWIKAQALAGGVGRKPSPITPLDLSESLVGLMAEVGDVATRARAALEDGELDCAEVRGIRKEAREAQQQLLELIASLGAFLDQGGGA